MIKIYYPTVFLIITALYIALRIVLALKNKKIILKREAQMLLVYICLIVLSRFTLFPFSRVNGEIQPLVLDMENLFPPRVNFIPLVYLFDYPSIGEILLNVIGNTAMFVPLGIVWPSVFKKPNTHVKVMLAGFGVSLTIEVLQLPFFDRVSDIDDLILNTLGFFLGYLIYLGYKKKKARR
ncbi:MAG: VanZ family protein [Clostridia bacterium]|nr:VanZ family protein [Clostridia bacterium]MBP3369817.1 VanZ family protein [Clostridia bacterium]